MILIGSIAKSATRLLFLVRSIMQNLMQLTDGASDYGDAFECGAANRIPVEVRIIVPGHGIKDARHLHALRLLVRDCEGYFSYYLERTFETETVVSLLRAQGEPERPNNAEVLEKLV